jgi:Protein of unknown function DUF72
MSTQVETGEREIVVLEDAHIRPMMGLDIEGGRCAARDTFHAHGREPVRRGARLQRTVRGLTANGRRETEHIDAGASLAEALTPSSRGKLNGTPCRSEDEMSPLRAQYCAAHGKPQQRKPLRYGVSATSCKPRAVGTFVIDYPGMPRMEEATADFSYIRWLGDRREFPEGHTHLKKDRDEDLSWWSELVDRLLGEGKTVFAYANNHYQNHSPSTVERFLELRRGER